MRGALYGDVIGSYYEVHCTKAYDFVFESESTFTDDSVLIAAVCRAILQNPNEIKRSQIRARAKEYAAQYRQYYAYFPYAGFGNMFAAWARNPYAKNGRSYANGAAMRVIPIAYAYRTLEQVHLQVRASCIPTHNHKEANRGALAVASAIFLARQGKSKQEIKAYLEKEYKYQLSIPLQTIRETHVFGSRSSYSVPPAIIAFLESVDYESAVRLAVSLGGDADTQACIAGGIAQAYYKEIPEHIRRFCEPRIDGTIKSAVRELEQRCMSGEENSI
ncbi:MAG: ADP-ribosylglycohydrolase family protein [Clostridia bacterium]|nr:ADP-ribosylglycohydrolase family protein [Clostridia bacterium]